MRIDPRRILLITAIVGIGLGVSNLHAQDEKPPVPRMAATQPASLSREMGAMDRDFKLLRRQVSDASANASSLTAVQDLEVHTLAAKIIPPRSATTMPSAAENAEKLADYRAMMSNVLRLELDLEDQLATDKNDKAAQTLASIDELQNQGHKDFRPPRRRRPASMPSPASPR